MSATDPVRSSAEWRPSESTTSSSPIQSLLPSSEDSRKVHTPSEGMLMKPVKRAPHPSRRANERSDGCRATEPRLLVMHPLCQPTEFTDPALARRFAVRMKRHGFAKVDVYEFDPLAGGWRKVDMS